MGGSEPVAVVRQRWDGYSYRVRAEAFEAWFVVGVEEDLEAVDNVDVDVRLADGSRWGATIFTLAEVARLLDSCSHTGEALSGAGFSGVSINSSFGTRALTTWSPSLAGYSTPVNSCTFFERLDD
jgi:hypothetical protein